MNSRQLLWIEQHDLIAIHGQLLAEHGGASGLRDRGLLDSALARPRQHLAYAQPDIISLAALYTSAIVRNHPFVDGNKRVGFVAGILFLELNGFDFEASEEDSIRAVLDLAAGTIDENILAEWLRENVTQQKR